MYVAFQMVLEWNPKQDADVIHKLESQIQVLHLGRKSNSKGQHLQF